MMDTNTLHSTNIGELKEKLTRFYFSRGGFFGGYESVDVIKNNNKIQYIYRFEPKEIYMECDISLEKWNTFTDKIFNEAIHTWEKSYYDFNVCDGEEWKLKMEFIDLPCFESSGSNEYPDNWDKFEVIIEENFPQMKIV